MRVTRILTAGAGRTHRAVTLLALELVPFGLVLEALLVLVLALVALELDGVEADANVDVAVQISKVGPLSKQCACCCPVVAGVVRGVVVVKVDVGVICCKSFIMLFLCVLVAGDLLYIPTYMSRVNDGLHLLPGVHLRQLQAPAPTGRASGVDPTVLATALQEVVVANFFHVHTRGRAIYVRLRRAL